MEGPLTALVTVARVQAPLTGSHTGPYSITDVVAVGVGVLHASSGGRCHWAPGVELEDSVTVVLTRPGHHCIIRSGLGIDTLAWPGPATPGPWSIPVTVTGHLTGDSSPGRVAAHCLANSSYPWP